MEDLARKGEAEKREVQQPPSQRVLQTHAHLSVAAGRMHQAVVDAWQVLWEDGVGVIGGLGEREGFLKGLVFWWGSWVQAFLSRGNGSR